MMDQAKPSDHAITRAVTQSLASRGMRPPCLIGVQRVLEKLRVIPIARHWK